MDRIDVYLKDEQEQWVRRVARELDVTDAEVIRRVIDVQREKRSDVVDGPASGPSGAGGAGSGETASDGGASREDLLERIEKLERELESEEDADSEDGGMGWR